MKTKKYVLTGGPGSGKSSILLWLEQKGEYVIREAAEDYIKYRQALGVAEPWVEINFQEEIFKLQIQRESIIPKGIERVFIDRGTLDGLAYLDEKAELYKKIVEKKPEYEQVFLIKNLKGCDTNTVRREDSEESMRIAQKLREFYQNYGYRVDTIENAPLERRAKQILEKIVIEKRNDRS